MTVYIVMQSDGYVEAVYAREVDAKAVVVALQRRARAAGAAVWHVEPFTVRETAAMPDPVDLEAAVTQPLDELIDELIAEQRRRS